MQQLSLPTLFKNKVLLKAYLIHPYKSQHYKFHSKSMSVQNETLELVKSIPRFEHCRSAHLAWSTLPWSLRMDRFSNLRTAIQSSPQATNITWQIAYALVLTFSAVVGKIYPSPTLILHSRQPEFPSSGPWSRECSLCLCLTQLVQEWPEATPCFAFPSPRKTRLDKRKMSGLKIHQSQNTFILAPPIRSVNRYEVQCGGRDCTYL